MKTDNQSPEKSLPLDGQIKEQPFTSAVPVVGPVIVFFRNAWNNVAAKWYVRPLLQQQNEFNLNVIKRLKILENRIREQEKRLVADDREYTHLVRETAEVRLQLADINGLLDDVEERLSEIERRIQPADEDRES